MEALVQTLLAEMPETVSKTEIMGYVPRLIQEAQKLAVPGADKKAAVVKALHDLVDAKVSKEVAAEFHAFIDETLVTTVDMLIDVAKGRVVLSAPQTVEEVTQKVNCFLQFVQAILKFATTCKSQCKSKCKKTDVPAAPAAPTPVEAAGATGTVPAPEVVAVAEAEGAAPNVASVAEEIAVAAKAAEIAAQAV